MKKIFFLILIFLQLFFSTVMAHHHQESGNDPQKKIQNPRITQILEAISVDSISDVMQSMVNMGTRFMYAENRREVASWIADKFRSYGYTDVTLDSFKIVGETVPEDSVWQYNVVATSTGASAPGEIYIISAHHDDYVNPDPHMPAPGADDNASGCAVAMEIARVLKLKGFQPEATIRFVTYAAEELVGYIHYSGSIYYAEKIATLEEDLRLDICNDMVANTTGTGFQIRGTAIETGPNTWTGNLMKNSVNLYTSIDMIPTDYPVSDSYRFWELGYPVAGFSEYGVTYTYHTIHDSVSNCNMELCLEVARANGALLLNEQLTPVPQEPQFISGKQGITVSWKETSNNNVNGYKIYRSTFPDSAFIISGEISGLTNLWTDTTALEGIKYYYYATSFDQDGYESTPSNIIFGAVAPKDRSLLVVKDSQGGFNNPADSAVNSFYQLLFANIEHDYTDASVADSLDISILGKYQRIFWFSNSFAGNSYSSFSYRKEDILAYLKDGGQLFLTGFQPSFLIAGNNKLNKTFTPEEPIYSFFKIGKVERIPTAMLNGAIPQGYGYDTLLVDSAKCQAQMQQHIPNVEVIHPTPDASVIYRWQTAFDTTTTQGKMKGKPVGIEYLGNDHKVIILSVPLYYLDSADAKTLAELVINEKFRSHVGIDPGVIKKNPVDNIRIHPNPCRDQAIVTYQIYGKSLVTIELLSMMGKRVIIPQEGIKEKGSYTFQIPISQLPAGIYMLILRSGEFIQTRKLIHIDY